MNTSGKPIIHIIPVDYHSLGINEPVCVKNDPGKKKQENGNVCDI
jgi:hypothetical protein